MFDKVLVANRGEIAVRAFRAAYELGARTAAAFPYADRRPGPRRKAAGGGRGMRRVERPEDLPAAVEAAMREAVSAFGDPTVFCERAVTGARHIEVQVLADTAGAVVHLFERDCSVQRRHQKVVELAP